MIGQKTKRDVGLAAVLLLLVAACAGVLADDVTHQVREPGAHCCFFFSGARRWKQFACVCASAANLMPPSKVTEAYRV